MESYFIGSLGVVAAVAEIIGVLTALRAVMEVRTPQGAIAWAVSLVTFPYIALPLYWMFGRSKFQGYTNARRRGDLEIHHIVEKAGAKARADELMIEDVPTRLSVFQHLAKIPFLKSNSVRLLIDGEQTFGEIFAAIERARQYVLIQFYIVRDDQIGREFKRRLIDAERRGVQVYFLYDEIGSYNLPRRYVRQLEADGAEVFPFHSTKGFWNRFQINFRNHRKIVVVDGEEAFVGGANIGDEYMGRDPRFGPWRDTHVAIRGPAVHAVQLSFIEDWYWATHRSPELDWKPRRVPDGDKNVLVLPTGPADDLESCGLFFMHAINAAQQRIWIASPYFVPDRQVITALQLASLRGVDVRVLLPEKPDHLLVYLSSFSFLDEAEQVGVKIYRYQPGFMHHKVLLIDDDLAAVGTANVDNRSFRLNFEITVLVEDRAFNAEVAEMLERDLANCRLARSEDLMHRSWPFKIAVRIARLMAPVQ